MKSLFIVSCSAMLFISCEKSEPIAVNSTRELTTADKPVNLKVTSSDRFEPPGTQQPQEESLASSSTEIEQADYTFSKPEDWTVKPASMFRTLNFSFAEKGEVYLSEVGGDLLGNLNRWYGQFGKPAITQNELKNLPQRVLLGKTAYLVEAEGGYNPGMGQAAKDNIKLIGAIAQIDNRLVTIKLLAPKEEADRQKGNFEAFLASLKK